MKKLNLVCMLLFAVLTVSMAQENRQVTVVGKVVEKETNEPIVQATVQLLSLPDSTMVNGNVTNLDGNFSVHAKPGKYVMKISYVGYISQFKTYQLNLNRPQVSAGTIVLEPDAILLKEAVVTAEASMVSASNDTLIYNSSAYRTSEGAVLEELVRKLPGAEVDDEGNVKINGKEVKKIMVNNKEFFGGDVATGLKNLPVEMIENLKTYDRKSDMARVTGIDDGNEETVLDLTVKKGMNKGLFGNLDLGVGNKDRYTSRGMVNYFKDKTQYSIIGSANNINNQGFGGGGPRWGSNGLSTRKMIGGNFATETEKLELGGSARYNYNDNNTISTGYSNRNLQSMTSYSNSNRANRSKNSSFNADFRLEWRPDSMTNLIFRPNFSYNESKTNSRSESSTFDEDPFSIIENPNDYLDFDKIVGTDPLRDIRVNAANDLTQGESNSISANATLQFNRKLNNLGRNITFRGRVSYRNGDNDSYTDSETRYYQFDYNPDSINYRRRYIHTPTDNYSYLGQMTYSEPLGKGNFLQFSYQFQYQYNKSNRHTFDLDSFGWRIGEPLPSNYEEGFDESLSKDATYKYFNHEVTAGFRMIRPKYQLDAGLSFQPQNTKLSYKRGTFMTDTTRSVFNFAPNFRYRYNFSKLSQLEITYRGRSSEPSMEDLLPITDDSNPLNIRMGNPGLKPSFSHNMRAFFNTYNPEKQQGVIVNINFNATQNSVTNRTEYNSQTGGNITMPVNINGNWNAFGMFGFNTALKNKKFNIGSFTRTNYTNFVSYQYKNQENLRNKTTNFVLAENLNATYRNSWFEFSLNGGIEYNWERNKLNPQNDQEPYSFSYGASTNIALPWNMTFTTNITNQARRGYEDKSMNRDEWIWNAQLAQSMFKGKATLSFEMYDILHERSSISRSVSSELTSVYAYNSINSYCMVHFIYRFNLFGTKNSRGNGNRGGFGGGFGGGRGPGGPPPGGGFGGGGRRF
ncbi:MAG: TonB-dependent receptor [Phocaeicola sp.]|nr:TonB-dependent receptor [Phocaeicola sp.]